ncbi:UNVERIFIED_CONTAM: aldehyde dehydrogenase (NADP(+)) [Microbacterium sp. SLM126]
MAISGEMFIGFSRARGSHGEITGIDPATGAVLAPPFGVGGEPEVARAAELARSAFDAYRATSPAEKAAFLDLIADNVDDLGEGLVERAHAETGLPHARLASERGRTVDQLRAFAAFVRAGGDRRIRIDPAQPARVPVPRPDIRQRQVPVGPVAVFGASNFPLAFSAAGGDVASALAAGCPVIVKAHNAHPGTSSMVAEAVVAAARARDLPDGVYSVLFGRGSELGARLVAHPSIAAVGFTGSRAAGLDLMRIAASRAVPIPVFAEMSSINPCFLLPSALAADPEGAADAFVASMTLGAGQFCTNPGLVIVPEGPDGDRFVERAAANVDAAVGATMLTAGIADAYSAQVAARREDPAAEQLARGGSGPTSNAPAPTIFQTTATAFLAGGELHGEVFGPSAVIVRTATPGEMIGIAENLEGQLTAAIHLLQVDETAHGLVRILERKAGRLICNAWPTGVEVTHAMVHGGPFPATSDGRSTSVGTLAIERFLRPVAYQGFTEDLLPAELQGHNPLSIERLIDGTSSAPAARA